MKKVSTIFAGVGMLFIVFFIISISASAAKKKDYNCLNRCKSDYKVCVKNVRMLKYKERMAGENECRRLGDTCVALCPDASLSN